MEQDIRVPENLIVVGDRVLVVPEDEDRTHSGLILPQGVGESEQVRSGRVVATGPGIAIPSAQEPDFDEPWKESRREDQRYIPMQVKVGDYCLFYKKVAVEVRYQGRVYLVVQQGAILIVIRDPSPGASGDGISIPPTLPEDL